MTCALSGSCTGEFEVFLDTPVRLGMNKVHFLLGNGVERQVDVTVYNAREMKRNPVLKIMTWTVPSQITSGA